MGYIRVLSGTPRVLGQATESKDSGRSLATSGDEISQEELEMELLISMLETQCLPQGRTQIECRPHLEEFWDGAPTIPAFNTL